MRTIGRPISVTIAGAEGSEAGIATAPQPDDGADEAYSLPPIVELSEEEGRALFERQARTYMGMSGEEFLRKWDAGEIDDPDRSEVLTVAFLIPLVRHTFM